MQYDEFIGQVQNRARLGTIGEAVRATRATLTALSERLAGRESEHLGAQLPEEIGIYLREPLVQESFDLNGFYRRVAAYEDVDLPDAAFHARSVISVVVDAVSPGEIKDVLAQLPQEFRPLFQGKQGEQQKAA